MKKSFTLIELLLSIVILSIMFLGVSNVIKELNKSKNIMDRLYDKNINSNLVYKVLYNDLLNSSNIKINNSKNYSNIILQTTNSLYKIPKPYVMWYVSKNKNSLMRLESPTDINLSNLNHYYLDKFLENVKIFKIYLNNNKKFVFIKSDKTIYFEF